MRKLTIIQKKHQLARAVDEVKKRNRIGKQRSLFTGKFIKRNTSSLNQKLTAPSIFNLQYKNVNDVLKYISQLKSVGSSGKDILIDLKNVVEIGEGAIAMLLTVLSELRTLHPNININGNHPSSIIADDILEKSRFFKYSEGYQVKEKNRIDKNTILTTGHANTSQAFLPKVIKDSMETVWGIRGRNPYVYIVTFEMMRNACDHAFKSENLIKWHFASTHIEEERLVKFSFVDNGKGILKTLKDGFLHKVLDLFRDNADVLETAFKDGINSRTGLSWRGKGLPTIFENYSENYIRNLIVISNDVFIDFDRKISEKLQVPFSGTYYYWIVDQNCEKICFI